MMLQESVMMSNPDFHITQNPTQKLTPSTINPLPTSVLTHPPLTLVQTFCGIFPYLLVIHHSFSQPLNSSSLVLLLGR